MPKRPLSLSLLFLGAASCGPTDNDPGPGGINASDARALDEAAQKLDIEQNKLPEKPPAE